jgi:hypothetical protein
MVLLEPRNPNSGIVGTPVSHFDLSLPEKNGWIVYTTIGARDRTGDDAAILVILRRTAGCEV